MSSVNEAAPAVANDVARAETEQRLIGWQLHGAPGVTETVTAEMRADGSAFQVPHARIQRAILAARDAGRTITVLGIAADLKDYAPLAGLGGSQYLQAMCGAAPAIISAEDGRKQACAAIREWRHRQSPLAQAGDVEIVKADAVAMSKVDWVWPGWLAAGKLHLIAGSPGTGKTTVALSLAATITKGGRFPCGWLAERGSALIWTGEDDIADTIVPRFRACSGDASRLHFVRGVRGENGETFPFDPASDMEALIAAARHIPDLRFMIVDPVVSMLPGIAIRTARLAVAFNRWSTSPPAPVPPFLASPTTARGPPAAIRRSATGSLAFTAVPRLVMVTAKPHDQGDLWRLVRAKSNIGPDGGGFEYDLQRKAVGDTSDIQGEHVVWGRPLEGSAQALLAEVEGPPETTKVTAVDGAKDWLPEFLGTGNGASVTAIREAAQAMGHSWAAVRRAKDTPGVEAFKQQHANGSWVGRRPKVLTGDEDAHHKTMSTLSAFEDAQDAQHERLRPQIEDAQDAHEIEVSKFDGVEHLHGNGQEAA